MNATEIIASFINETSFDDLPVEIVTKAKLAFLDWLGVTLQGSRDPSSLMFRSTLEEFSGSAQATVIGHSEKIDIISAAFLNGYFSHVLDYDDVQMGWCGHPSVTIFPTITALSEWRGIGGRNIITAFVIGVEVESRVGAAVMPTHYDRGWHSTSTVGHFGAAAAASSILGLDTKTVVNALGTAGTQAAGLRQMFGTMCKPLHAGKAAANGLLAALLASRGFTSSKDVIGGDMGFGKVLSDNYNPSAITDNLGKTWEVERIVFKFHASCYSTHALVDCALSLHDRVRACLEKISSVRCQIASVAANIAKIKDPQTGLEGKFCQPFCAAIALAEGNVGEEQFSNEKVMDSTIRRLIGKIDVEGSSSMQYGEAVMEVVLNDGRSFKEHVIPAETTQPPHQLLPSLVDKFTGFVAGHLSDHLVETLVEAVMELDSAENLERIIKLLPRMAHDNCSSNL